MAKKQTMMFEETLQGLPRRLYQAALAIRMLTKNFARGRDFQTPWGTA